MGLAYPGMKAGGDWHKPFFDRLMEQGITSFAFDFNDSAPELIFNPTLEDEQVAWNPVINQLFWSLDLDRVYVRYGDQELTLCSGNDGRRCMVTPDSGTSAVTFPTWAIKQARDVWFERQLCSYVDG